MTIVSKGLPALLLITPLLCNGKIRKDYLINLKYIVASSLIALNSASKMHPSSHPEKYLLFCHPIPKIFFALLSKQVCNNLVWKKHCVGLLKHLTSV